MNKPRRPRSALLLVALLASAVLAARADTDAVAGVATGVAAASDGAPDNSSDTVSSAPDPDIRATLDRLLYIQGVLQQRIVERSALGERIEAANEQDKGDLREQADKLTEEIGALRRTLESIATGGVDPNVFGSRVETEDGDWRQDIALIARPVIDSLKDITEKPRRIKAQNDEIAARETELDVAKRALEGLAPERALVRDEALARTLEKLAERWQKRADDAAAAIEIARFQIASLRGDKTLWETVRDALREFATGRGLTLLLAVGASMSVWYGSRFLLRRYRRRLVDKSEPESRTRYRLAEYSLHAFTGLLMLVAIFVVFYQRGDVLLLGLMILLFVGLALGARQMLPRYLNEARLLLNIGPMREGERVLYRDLPWRVESVNMYTVLRNPELHGVLRVPLGAMQGVVSRPAGKDPWFPTSRGDAVLLESGEPFEVLDQNPDTVTLRERGGQLVTLPSAAFYATTMTNLSRGGTFGVRVVFGLDYDQQPIAVSDVPRILRTAVRDALARSDIADSVRDVVVELQAAGDSSLDYWLFATLDSRAAKSCMRVRRMIHGACVEACTREGWNIPFPHLSVVSKSATP